jgi:TctA family transporter
MMEANLRRALITGNESFGYLFTKPITVTLLLVAMIVLLSQLFSRKRVA